MNARAEIGQITLEPFTEAHITLRYLGWLNDKNLMCYSEQRRKVHTRETALAFLASMKGPSLFMAVMEGDQHVGNVCAYVDAYNRVADLSILIGEPGRGIGSVAWELAIAYTFARTGVRKIEAGTMATNDAMLTLFVKSGMAIEGRRYRHFMLGLTPVDLIQAAIFR